MLRIFRDGRFRRGFIEGLLACLSATGFAQTSAYDLRANHAALIIRVYKLANIKPRDLAKAEGLASRILADAGVTTEWRDSDVNDTEARTLEFRGSSGSTCPEPLRSREFAVEIAKSAPAWLPNGSLGRALPCARQGIVATVFNDQVAAVAQHTLTGYIRVLGHALAHEIGHVLLQSNEHTAEGLMRGVWSRADWQRAAVAELGFSRDEAARIKAMLATVRERR